MHREKLKCVLIPISYLYLQGLNCFGIATDHTKTALLYDRPKNTRNRTYTWVAWNKLEWTHPSNCSVLTKKWHLKLCPGLSLLEIVD